MKRIYIGIVLIFTVLLMYGCAMSEIKDDKEMVHKGEFYQIVLPDNITASSEEDTFEQTDGEAHFHIVASTLTAKDLIAEEATKEGFKKEEAIASGKHTYSVVINKDANIDYYIAPLGEGCVEIKAKDANSKTTESFLSNLILGESEDVDESEFYWPKVVPR